jgi:hypothetical protein
LAGGFGDFPDRRTFQTFLAKNSNRRFEQTSFGLLAFAGRLGRHREDRPHATQIKQMF